MTQAIRVSPANVDDLIFLAELNIGQNRGRPAVDWLQKARAANPNVREIYELLAAQFMALGDYRSALNTLKQGIELFPDDSKLTELDKKARSATLDGMLGTLLPRNHGFGTQLSNVECDHLYIRPPCSVAAIIPVRSLPKSTPQIDSNGDRLSLRLSSYSSPYHFDLFRLIPCCRT